MNSLMHDLFLAGDLIELDQEFYLPPPEVLNKYQWVKYNPRKNIDRYGLSLTSLDGGMSGYPDLDSLLEYYRQTGESLPEMSFKEKTPLFYDLGQREQDFLNNISLGRSHFLKLNSGGFFPPHRDSGHLYGEHLNCFRIISCLQNCDSKQFVWLQDGVQFKLRPNRLYVINTLKIHSVFSFVDDCIILVLNVGSESIPFIKSRMDTK